VEILFSRAHDSLTAASIDEISGEEMTSEEREAVTAILSGNAHRPFSRIGWTREAMAWMRAELGQDIEFTGEVRQFNASGSFALVRFSTQTGSAYWLKATGEPNAHEFHVTRMLAKLCPEYLPRQIAAREDWNAWLMEDAGQPLDSMESPVLEEVVNSMSRVQRRTIGRTGEFLAAGALDQRIGTLRTHLPELTEYLQEAMAKQTSTKVTRLDRHRIFRLEAALRDACLRMEDVNIPDTLVHNDVNRGNLLFKGMRCCFTDWCEAGVGNPFLGFEYLCLLQPRSGEDWRPRLWEAYKQCWIGFLEESAIDEAFAFSPLLAMLASLYGRSTWFYASRRNLPHVESYARSLARHMDRAAQDPLLLEALCH
jgi:aminoglycoside phosphotransferase (APT) family kinase protein